MKREIIKLGTSTLVASLPSKWIKKFHLKQGDEINIEEEENRLVITKGKEHRIEHFKIDISTLPPLVNYGLTALYLRGIDEIEVRSENPKLIERLQEHPIPQFVGWEIVEQEKTVCKIKDLSGAAADMDFKSLIRRMFLITKSIAAEMLEAMENKQTKLSHIRSIDANANKFAFLCQRKLNKTGYTNYRETPVMYYLIVMLEATGDLYRDLAEYITEKKVTFSPKSIEFFKKVNNLFNDYYSVFFGFDLKLARDIDRRYREFRVDIDKYIDSIKSTRELRCLIFMSNITDYLSEMLRNQLVITL